MTTLKFLTILSAVLLGYCFPSSSQNTGVNSNMASQKNGPANRLEAGENATTVNSDNGNLGSASAKLQCLETRTGGKFVVMKTQTFPIDFDPFPGSCFVTYYNREYPDPPMESHYSIFKGDKVAFDFPEQFNGATFGCWVDGVSFQDLNKDRLKDVIVIGKCSAKAGPYNEN